MEDWSAEELARGLRGHLDPKIIDKLKEQQVTGENFLHVTASTLKLFNFPMGHILPIVNLIEQLKSKELVLVLESSPSNSPLRSQATSQNTQDLSWEDDLTQSDKEADDILRQYVNEDYLNKQSSIVLEGYRNRCKRWKQMKDAGLSYADKPHLSGIPSSAMKGGTKVNLGSGSPGRKLRNNSRFESASDSDDSDDNSKENVNSSSKSKGTKSLSGSSPLKERNLFSKSSRDSHADKISKSSSCQQTPAGCSSKPSTSRQQLQKPRHEKEADDSCDDNDEDEEDNTDEDETGGSSETQTYTPPPLPFDKDTIAKIKPELQSFDVEKILLSDAKTKVYVPSLQKGLLFKKETVRKRLFRTIVATICREHTEKNNPSGKMKESIAKSIVVTYPQFQKLVAVKDKTPWSHIYGNNSGNVANIVKRLQRGVLKTKKKIKKKTKPPSDGGVDIVKLGLILAEPVYWPEIVDGMTRSFQLRVKDRQDGLSITELISKYPHLVNFKGAIITHEFKLMHPDAQDMVLSMQPLIPKVLEKLKDARVNPKWKDDTLKAFMLIAAKLPHHISKAISFPREVEIVVVLKLGMSVEQCAEERRFEDGSAVQPYIIVVVGTISNEILQTFLVLDGKPMELGRIPFIRCVDWLFKSCFVFNAARGRGSSFLKPCTPNGWTLSPLQKYALNVKVRLCSTCLEKVL
ncbi:Retrotransposon-like protein 1 [Frankliniella fusca]|uniref:Retrotransposon-like protein 1 n=1 Tax=Frankliniella fusca TaxID=407009 RepID=A0AAE1L7G0_9NEOP|nr:Retrotransposon-like protein 1 [Frankliniella fusca]KAK3910158.1 Retrotransposon-like protein 1 [Frankliniella fusca]